jgi:di/tricarboxylate transporter
VAKVAARKGLIPAEADDLRSATPSRVLVEAVVAPGSPLVGRSINQAAFRTHYNAAVVALARQGSGMSDSLGDHVLHAGDVLLLESAPAFLEQFRHSSDFFLVGGVDHAAAREHGRAPVALGLLLMMVLSVALGLVDLLPAALLAAAAMIVTRCCSPIQARRAIDERLLLTIAGAVGIGSALAATGVAASVAESVVALSAGSPWLALVALYVVAVIATELVTNTAAAVLLWPLALGIADDLSVSVLPFALALMVAASASFITPLGYQTNLMVAGPGGYRFTDFIRAGLPVSLVVGTVAVVLIPMLFPFA